MGKCLLAIEKNCNIKISDFATSHSVEYHFSLVNVSTIPNMQGSLCAEVHQNCISSAQLTLIRAHTVDSLPHIQACTNPFMLLVLVLLYSTPPPLMPSHLHFYSRSLIPHQTLQTHILKVLCTSHKVSPLLSLLANYISKLPRISPQILISTTQIK